MSNYFETAKPGVMAVRSCCGTFCFCDGNCRSCDKTTFYSSSNTTFIKPSTVTSNTTMTSISFRNHELGTIYMEDQ